MSWSATSSYALRDNFHKADDDDNLENGQYMAANDDSDNESDDKAIKRRLLDKAPVSKGGAITVGLPTAFYSRHRAQPVVYYVVGFLLTVFPSMYFLGLVSQDDYGHVTSLSRFFYLATIVSLFGGLLTLCITWSQSYSHYLEMTSSNSWTEGVFIFPYTGEIVVRFQSMLAIEEQMIYMSRVKTVEITQRRPFVGCNMKPFIRIVHDFGVYEFDATRLRDDPEKVVAALRTMCHGLTLGSQQSDDTYTQSGAFPHKQSHSGNLRATNNAPRSSGNSSRAFLHHTSAFDLPHTASEWSVPVSTTTTKKRSMAEKAQEGYQRMMMMGK